MKKVIVAVIVFVLGMLGAILAKADVSGSPTLWERCAYGGKPGCTFVPLDGYNGAITTTNEPLTPESAAYAIRTAAMTTPYCASSDDTNDKAAGTGALTINVSGVNTSYAAFSETVTMNGQASVNLATANVLFINSISVLTSGSTGANTGTIRCGTGTNTAGVAAVVEAHMPIGAGRSQAAMYMIPASYKLVCRDFVGTSYGTTAGQTVQFTATKYPDPVNSTSKLVQNEILGYLSQQSSSVLTSPGYRVYSEKTLVMLRALSAASTGPVHGRMECLLLSTSWVSSAQDLF